MAQPADRRRDVAVCAALAEEQHEFGALLVALLARSSGWQAVYLGPAAPAEEIARMARRGRAKLVLVSVVALPRDEAEGEIGALARAVPAGVRIVVGGRGISPGMKLPRRVEHVPRVEELSL
jgi:methylmalonyl-CoA mutase cobalamin-binding subunit